MILAGLTPSNVGPFFSKEIQFEEDVTVFTGGNDTGKSVLLRLIANCLSKDKGASITQDDVNFDYLSGCKTPWDDDMAIVARLRFRIPNGKQVGEGVANLHLAPKHRNGSPWERPGMRGQLSHQELQTFPDVLFVDSFGEGIREAIQLESPNVTESRLLRVAFGRDFSFQALKELTPRNYHAAIAKAENTLNERLNQILPPTLSYQFRFHSYADRVEELFVTISDTHGGSTGLSKRGTGIKTLINLLGSLATENHSGKQLVILLDEPELHLHADAQHALRNTLEKLGSADRIQVIYSTHSPCMVNPMRPRSVRLLTRVTNKKGAFSTVDHEPYADGFASVRSSLGISLADSLLFSPITVLVEGKTEVVCIPRILEKLSAAKRLSNYDLESIMSQTLFLEAVGVTNIPNLVRISRGHGSTIIAFVDGDSSTRWRAQMDKIGNRVPLIICVENGEFEEIVPQSIYFDALREEYPENATAINVEAFTLWVNTLAPQYSKLAFTKKIALWLSTALDINGPEKAAVMRRAVELVDPAEIKIKPFDELLSAIISALEC